MRHYCSYCGWINDGPHAPACPRDTPKGSDERRYWNNGYTVGFERQRTPTGLEHPAWKLGWTQGDVAAEEAENRAEPVWGHRN